MKSYVNEKNIIKKFFLYIGDIFVWLFDFKDWKKLLRSIPGFVTSIFVVSVVVMNLMASKVIIQTSFFGFTGGLLLSWVPFLVMDIVTKTYGAKAAIKLNIFGLIINCLCVGLFELISLIQIGGDLSTYTSFNSVFSATWQIFVASSIAYLISGIVNNILNSLIGKLFKKNPDGRVAYMCRSYISTMIGQFVDNFVFIWLAFLVFFKFSIGTTCGYTLVSALGTALIGAVVELLMEVIFSGIGYRICQKRRRENVGEDYLSYCHQKELIEDQGRIKY